MGKKVSLETHQRQNDTISNLKYKIRQTEGAITTTYDNINQLNQELSIQKSNRAIMYGNKIEWENNLARIISDIEKENGILKDLLNDYDNLKAQYANLTGDISGLNTTDLNLNQITHTKDRDLYRKVEDDTEAGNRHYNDIEDQNKTMYNTILDLKNELTTHDKKTFNQNINKSEYITMHTGLFYLYYILAIILLYFLYVKKYIINKYAFVFVFVVIILYPYYILTVEKHVYGTITFLWALIKGIPYTNE